MGVRIDLASKRVTLGVGDLLAEPAANVGRVGGISAWTRMALGRETHAVYQRQQTGRHTGYAREVAIKYQTAVDDFAVTVQGRIDGVIPPVTEGEPWVVEEIKSAVLPPLMFAALAAETHPHYVEQLRLYCFFIAAMEQKPTSGRLVFINVADNERREFNFAGPFDDCAKLIADRVRVLLGQAQAEQQRRAGRRFAAANLTFPHRQPRRHQDEMIAAVERALAGGRHLLVNAPSGIGKTAGALFPVVKDALANGRRVFLVTAKNTQQEIAVETLRKMGAAVAVQIHAREKMCINSVYACREEFCPHLQMFPAKIQQTGVLERLLDQGIITPAATIAAGRGSSVCPFELALMAAEKADVIVCDYNYVFDPQVYFRRFFQDADHAEDVLVIDEAHNLVQRAMDYYSPVLRRREIHALSRHLGHVEPKLARDLRKFLRALDDVFESLAQERGDEYSQLADEDETAAPAPASATGERKFVIASPRPHFNDLKPAFTKLTVRYLLDKVMGGRAIPDDPVEEFFAAFAQFCAVLAMEGDEFAYVFDGSPGQALAIVCMDPSARLADRVNGFHSVIAMSATLAPIEFYRQMLGFDNERTETLSLPSPFPPDQRQIVVVPNVLTTFRARAGNYARIADTIAATAAAHAGNYMALFPSYDFLRGVAEHLPAGDWQLLRQEARMNEAQRRELIAALATTDPPKLVLGVQGGLFAEGVDFAGERLIGVIVVSPALPQVSFERELMRRYYDQRYGKGFEFAFLYPGMNRVIQSVGRVIRTETDRGVAILVCQRFKQTQYASLFPADWAACLIEARSLDDLSAKLRGFWR